MEHKCGYCGGKVEIVPLTIKQRMNLRLGRSWLGRCTSCYKEMVVPTFKQMAKATPSKAKKIG